MDTTLLFVNKVFNLEHELTQLVSLSFCKPLQAIFK